MTYMNRVFFLLAIQANDNNSILQSSSTSTLMQQTSDAATVVAIIDPRLTSYLLTSVIAMMCVECEGRGCDKAYDERKLCTCSQTLPSPLLT